MQPAWKQEINQRLAAHKNRKGNQGTTAEQAAKPGNSRAAEAAARVAARYAKAPSYSEMQAEEARVAVRAAEIATQVALEAQAVAESALAELHSAAEQPMRGPAVIESITTAQRAQSSTPVAEPSFVWEEEEPGAAQQSSVETADRDLTDLGMVDAETVTLGAEPVETVSYESYEGRSFGVRWDPDLPVRPIEMTPAPRVQNLVQDPFELAVEDWWTPAQVNAKLHNEPIAVDAQQSHANLIEFPRELVATRKMRPRLAETMAGGAVDQEGQLSIFEVDPGAVSAEPMAESMGMPSAAQYSGAEWSGMELDAHPARIEAPQARAERMAGPYLAPFGIRLMAMVVDGCLIMGSFFAMALCISSKLQEVPSPKTAEALVLLGLVITGVLYHALFFALSKATPGMKYAGLAFCTFDEEVPTQKQLRKRLGSMVLSLLPVGLGMMWAVFDEDHLSWHDRMSGTYLRKR